MHKELTQARHFSPETYRQLVSLGWHRIIERFELAGSFKGICFQHLTNEKEDLQLVHELWFDYGVVSNRLHIINGFVCIGL